MTKEQLYMEIARQLKKQNDDEIDSMFTGNPTDYVISIPVIAAIPEMLLLLKECADKVQAYESFDNPFVIKIRKFLDNIKE